VARSQNGSGHAKAEAMTSVTCQTWDLQEVADTNLQQKIQLFFAGLSGPAQKVFQLFPSNRWMASRNMPIHCPIYRLVVDSFASPLLSQFSFCDLNQDCNIPQISRIGTVLRTTSFSFKFSRDQVG
jgi:hypothetical protein